MKARFTDEQIIAMIKEQESGGKTADVCRRHGISSATFYKYKSKYGGLIRVMPESMLAFAPHQNSYRRLCPDGLAPTTAAWGYENRTAAIRIPGGAHMVLYSVGKAKVMALMDAFQPLATKQSNCFYASGNQAAQPGQRIIER